MSSTWPETKPATENAVLAILTELYGKRSLSRGQSKSYGGLIPSIDRSPRTSYSRPKKLALERQSIDIFRSTARFFADEGERGALNHDVVAPDGLAALWCSNPPLGLVVITICRLLFRGPFKRQEGW